MVNTFSLAVMPFLLFATLVAGAAPPEVSFFFPAGVQRGQSTKITATGEFETWPVNVWVDRPGVEVKPTDTKGELSVTVAEDFDFGVCWLRLYDEEGATPPRPLMVGSLGEVLEAEPNDAPAKSQPLDGSVIVNGKLAKRGDVDTYSVNLEEGQTLIASLRASNVLNAPMDAVLQITDEAGFVLMQNDDARGLDPLIVFPVPAAGTYLVRTFAFPAKPNSTIDFAGGEDYIYRLTLTTGPFLDHTMPLAVTRNQTTDVRLHGWNLTGVEVVRSISLGSAHDKLIHDFVPHDVAGMMSLPVTPHKIAVESPVDTGASPQTVEVPVVISGTLKGDRETDTYRFRAVKNQKLKIAVASHAVGFPTDPVIEVIDSSGKQLAENDDASRTERDAQLIFTPPADGEFDVRVRDLHGRGGDRFVYQLTVEPDVPSFQLAVKPGEFILEVGKPLEIPVAVGRDSGYTKSIEITAIDLPVGVSVEPAISEGKGDTAKEVKLKLTASEDATSGSFRIVGKAQGDEQSATTGFTLYEGSRTHSQLWLTVRP